MRNLSGKVDVRKFPRGSRVGGSRRAKKKDRYSPGAPLAVAVPAVNRRDRPPPSSASASSPSSSSSYRVSRAPFTDFAIDVEDAASSRTPRSPHRRLYFPGSHATHVGQREAIDWPRRETREAYADVRGRARTCEDSEAECGKDHSERSHRSAATGCLTTDGEAGKGRTATSRAPLRSAVRKLSCASRRQMARNRHGRDPHSHISLSL